MPSAHGIGRQMRGSDDEDWSASEESSSSDSDLSDIEAKDMETLRRYFLKVTSTARFS